MLEAPSFHALLLQHLETRLAQILRSGKQPNILVVNCGTGYMAACLALLSGQGGQVLAVDRHSSCTYQAQKTMDSSYPELSDRVKFASISSLDEVFRKGSEKCDASCGGATGGGLQETTNGGAARSSEIIEEPLSSREEDAGSQLRRTAFDVILVECAVSGSVPQILVNGLSPEGCIIYAAVKSSEFTSYFSLRHHPRQPDRPAGTAAAKQHPDVAAVPTSTEQAQLGQQHHPSAVPQHPKADIAASAFETSGHAVVPELQQHLQQQSQATQPPDTLEQGEPISRGSQASCSTSSTLSGLASWAAEAFEGVLPHHQVLMLLERDASGRLTETKLQDVSGLPVVDYT